MFKYWVIAFLLFPVLIYGQKWKSRPVSIEVFNNATLLPPASLLAVARQPIHPGLTIGYEFNWKENSKGKWFETIKLGYFYHQFVNQNVQLYTDFGYQRYVKKFAFRGSLLAGYMNQFVISPKLLLQSDGQYKIQNVYLRPQFMGGVELGTSYNINNFSNPIRVMLNYQIWVQTPFVSGYVPLLPNGALKLGVQFGLNNILKKHDNK